MKTINEIMDVTFDSIIHEKEREYVNLPCIVDSKSAIKALQQSPNMDETIHLYWNILIPMLFEKPMSESAINFLSDSMVIKFKEYTKYRGLINDFLYQYGHNENVAYAFNSYETNVMSERGVNKRNALRLCLARYSDLPNKIMVRNVIEEFAKIQVDEVITAMEVLFDRVIPITNGIVFYDGELNIDSAWEAILLIIDSMMPNEMIKVLVDIALTYKNHRNRYSFDWIDRTEYDKLPFLMDYVKGEGYILP